MMNEEINDEEFFDLLDDFAGPMVEMEWTMTDEEYESRYQAWWTAQHKERNRKKEKREKTREERLDRLYSFYHDENNMVNERSPFDD